MKQTQLIPVILSLLVLVECKFNGNQKPQVEYKEGKQVPVMDSTLKNIGFYAPDSIAVGEEYCAKMWLINKSMNALRAFTMCDFNSALVDTTNQTLDNCDSMQLRIIHDTAYFCLQPVKPSKGQADIALLTVDTNGIYHLSVTTIHYLFYNK